MTQAVEVHTKSTVLATEEQIENALVLSDWRAYDGGLFCRSTGAGGIFLMLNGQLQHVPNPPTYSNLFTSSAKVTVDNYIMDNAPRGADLTNGAMIAVAESSAPQYLVTNGVKMWIPSPAVVSQFNFRNPTAVPPILIDFIPTGPNVG